MSESNLSMVELVRRNGMDDIVVLAKIERDEYLAELLYSAASGIKQAFVSVAQGLSHALHSVFSRHAH